MNKWVGARYGKEPGSAFMIEFGERVLEQKSGFQDMEP